MSTSSAQVAALYCVCFDWQRNTGLKFNREFVRVIAGTDEDTQKYLVPKEMITRHHPRLFDDIRFTGTGAQCIGWFKKGKELEKEVFIGLLQFAYHGKFFRGNGLDTLWKLYIFAENHRLVDLEDILMDRIVQMYKNTQPSFFPDLRHIELVYKNTKRDSAARKFLSLCYSRLMNRNFLVEPESTCTNEELAKVGMNTDGLLLDMITFMNTKGRPHDVDWDPRTASPCLYHHHIWGARCPNFRENN